MVYFSSFYYFLSHSQAITFFKKPKSLFQIKRVIDIVDGLGFPDFGIFFFLFTTTETFFFFFLVLIVCFITWSSEITTVASRGAIQKELH